MEISRSEIIEKVKSYSSGKKEVIMSFLFGSYASGNYCKESDIDVAVFLSKEGNDLEIEIQNELEKLLAKETDVVFLNRSPATLSWNILRKGIPIEIKNRKTYLNLMLDVSSEAEDFQEFNLDAWRMKNGNG